MRADLRVSGLQSPAERIVDFVRVARANHFKVGIQEEIDALKTAAWLGVVNRHRIREGLRTLLCSNAAEWARFDELFDEYWRTVERVASAGTQSRARMHAQSRHAWRGMQAETDTDAAQREQGEQANGESEGASHRGASRREVLESKDFRCLVADHEIQEMEQWIEKLAQRMRRLLRRRLRIAARGRRIHMRRTMRRNLRYGGVPLELVFQQRRRELPGLVLILDVSRSMSLYSYLFLRFARGMVDCFTGAEAFVLHTRLVHVTDALREPDPQRLKEKLTLISRGWAGGTRIGESLQAFNRAHARRVIDSRTFVLIMSDGYDTGSAGLLAEQIGAIKRRARRVIWLNPLLGREGYTPAAAGMQAALPHIDLFLPAHNLASLRRIGDQLTAL